VPWWGAAVREWLLVGGATLLLCWLLARAGGARVDMAVDRASAIVLGLNHRLFVALSVAAAVAITAGLGLYCFNRQPHSVDEMATLWHARILLAGHFSLPAPAHPEFFSTLNVVDRGGWYSQFPVGGPAILALGMALGATWLVNPALSGVAAWSVYRFVRATDGEVAARYATILLLVTPFFLFMGASFQNHVPALALTWIALAALANWRAAALPRVRAGCACAIGLSLGALATIRPLDAMLAALVVGACQLATVWRLPGRAPELALQVVAGAVPVSLLLLANAHSTGHPLTMAYDLLWGPQRLGFGPSPVGPPHTPLRAIGITSASLMRLDMYLFEWPLPSLFPVVATLLLVRRPTTWDAVLGGVIVAFVVGYGLYWHEGFYLGPRYLFAAVPAFLIFASRAAGLIAARSPDSVARAARLAVPALVVAGALGAGDVTGFGVRAEQYRDGIWRLKADLPRQVDSLRLTNALVFVREAWESRLAARMWASGLSRPETERLLPLIDACRLEGVLDRMDSAGVQSESERRAAVVAAATPGAGGLERRPDLTADQMLRFAHGAPLAPECRRELAMDSAGVSLYAPFLLLDEPQRDGTLGGAAIFVRDLGERNEVLRAEYGSRRWLRWVPRRSPTDSSPLIAPY